jgi:peptide/nickel transport system permease protein
MIDTARQSSNERDRHGASPAARLEPGLPTEHTSMARLYVRRFLRHRFATAGLVVLVLVVLSALLAPTLTQDPNALSASDRKATPSAEHWLGTDEAGRDILARTVHGGRISLAVGITATGIALLLGTLIGAIAGYFGGAVDAVLMRLTDAFLCFPQLFVLIVFGTLIRTTELRVLQGNMTPIAIIIGILSWMGLARIVRATFLSLREQDYVDAARSVGAGNARIMVRHILRGRADRRPGDAADRGHHHHRIRAQLSRLRRAAADLKLGQPARWRQAVPADAADVRDRSRHDDLPDRDEHQLRR